MLEEAIEKAQDNDPEATVFMIEKFKPLLRKYATKLCYDDAFYDLQLDFLQIILTIDLGKRHSQSEGALVKYIANSVYHAYCKRLDSAIRQRAHTVSIDDLSDFQREKIFRTEQIHEPWKLPSFPKSLLTDKETEIICLVYEQQFTAAEIARRLNTTRQNISQCKKRAERKIRWYYESQIEFNIIKHDGCR